MGACCGVINEDIEFQQANTIDELKGVIADRRKKMEEDKEAINKLIQEKSASSDEYLIIWENFPYNKENIKRKVDLLEDLIGYTYKMEEDLTFYPGINLNDIKPLISKYLSNSSTTIFEKDVNPQDEDEKKYDDFITNYKKELELKKK